MGKGEYGLTACPGREKPKEIETMGNTDRCRDCGDYEICCKCPPYNPKPIPVAVVLDLHDVLTHRSSWNKLFDDLKAYANERSEYDECNYFEHERTALNRLLDLLEANMQGDTLTVLKGGKQ